MIQGMRWGLFSSLLVGLAIWVPTAAEARQECHLGPYTRQISKTIWVRDSKLFCTDIPEPTANRIEQARQLLKLCREMGGTQEDCNRAVARSGDGAIQPVVDVLRQAERRRAEKEKRIAAQPTGGKPVWKTKRLLTNE